MEPMEKELWHLRKEMFLKDYELSIGIIEKRYDTVQGLRKLELTILPAMLAFGLAQNLRAQLPLLTLAVAFLFAMLELTSRAEIAQVAEWLKDSEMQLQASEQDLAQLLANHKYIMSRDKRRTLQTRLETVRLAARSGEFWTWNIALVLAVTLLLLLL